MRTQTTVRLIKHGTSSYEVRTSTWFYFDDNPGRRAISGHAAPEDALRAAQRLARTEHDRTRGEPAPRNDTAP